MTIQASFPISRGLAILAACATLLLVSCTGRIGYGVMNWSAPEYALAAGDVVPVFIQSNIGKVYVVGTGKGFRTHAEIPLWQLDLYKSRSAARKASDALGEFRHTYALVRLDGLPIRAKPENTARQVYRLKEGQKIKVLAKGTGTPVLAGKSPLEGEWLEVMADDGTKGWCFSYNLTIFDEREEASVSVAASSTGPDTALEGLLARPWYPDSFRAMVQDNRVDLSRISPRWGFFPGRDSLVARVETADGLVTFPYTSIQKVDDTTYRFDGSTLSVQVRGPTSILVQYTDEAGMPHALYFASLDATPDDLISAEKERRAGVLDSVRKAGPRFVSGNYGVLQFLDGGRFLWSGYQLLSPSVIPAGAGAGGTVEPRCFLPETLASVYDGVLTFSFDSSPRPVHFLYALGTDGLKLEQVSDSNIRDSLVLAQNMTPIVVFFKPDPVGGQ